MNFDEAWLKKYLEDRYSHNPFVNLLELKITSMQKGKACMSMPVTKDKHVNLFGFAHGGAIATLADTAMGVACATMQNMVVTLDMNLNFIRSGKPGSELICVAEVIHSGKSTMVVDGTVYDTEDKIVAKSRGTFFVQGQFTNDTVSN